MPEPLPSIIIKFLFPFFLCFFSINAPAQCPQIYSGTKTLYSSTDRKYTAPPKGYAPVFINYVGRHGARHLTKDVNVSFAYALLQQADSLQGLSAEGKN
jgi:multiple inositol-polyphosphate phosphatase/2,3-bisphosphoglycerate 3-phosphatase